jgi:glycosyltransferase involved in cell wall biosynthesis
LKVLIPIGSFYPAQVGGPSSSLYWISKALCENGLEVKVITTNKGIKTIENNKWVKKSGFKVIYTTYGLWQIPVRMLFNILKEIRKCDVVILSSLFYLPSIFTVFLAMMFRKKIIVSPRGELSSSALKYHSLSKSIRLFFIRSFYSKHIIFHATSEDEENNIRSYFNKNRVIVIPNLFYLTKPLNSELANRFLFIGRIHPIKNIENILSALNFNEFKESNYQFVIIGFESKKGYLNHLKSLTLDLGLENHVRFLGEMFGEEKEIEISKSKFLFLVSKSENFGNVVIESLAHGTPVIASKNTPWQILEDYNAGFWVNESPLILRETIIQILNIDSNEYQQMRVNARRLVEENFDINLNISKWINKLNNNETNYSRP